jgi:hypothetical protein
MHRSMLVCQLGTRGRMLPLIGCTGQCWSASSEHVAASLWFSAAKWSYVAFNWMHRSMVICQLGTQGCQPVVQSCQIV